MHPHRVTRSVSAGSAKDGRLVYRAPSVDPTTCASESTQANPNRAWVLAIHEALVRNDAAGVHSTVESLEIRARGLRRLRGAIEALVALREAIALPWPAQFVHERARLQLLLAETLLRSGQVEQGRRILRAIAARARARSDWHIDYECRMALATFARDNEQWEEARNLANGARCAAIDAAEPMAYLAAALVLASACEGSGDRREAFQVIVSASRSLRRWKGAHVGPLGGELLRALRVRWGDAEYLRIARGALAP